MKAHAASGTGIQATISAAPADKHCGPNVPNDSYYSARSSAATVVYHFAPHAEVTLTENSAQPIPASVPALQKLITSAQSHKPTDPYGWYGGYFTIKLDAQGRIATISEIFHP